MEDVWHFIINPKSGKGKGIALWQSIEPLLIESEINYKCSISQFHKHSIELVNSAYAKGVRKFIGIGGDGTINEIVNGIFKENLRPELCTVSLLSVGTGNDWVRNHREKISKENIIDKLKSNQSFLNDVGGVSVNGKSQKHYFINIAGAGIDGSVVKELDGNGANKNKLAYVFSLIKTLFRFISPFAEVYFKQKDTLKTNILVVTAALGQYFGGGMHLSPLAKANKGLLDFTIARKDKLWVIFRQLYKLFNGQISTASFIEKDSGPEMKVVFENEVSVQADGEYVGETKELEFFVINNALRVLH